MEFKMDVFEVSINFEFIVVDREEFLYNLSQSAISGLDVEDIIVGEGSLVNDGNNGTGVHEERNGKIFVLRE